MFSGVDLNRRDIGTVKLNTNIRYNIMTVCILIESSVYLSHFTTELEQCKKLVY